MKSEEKRKLKAYLAGRDRKEIRQMIVDGHEDPELQSILLEEWKRTSGENLSGYRKEEIWEEFSNELLKQDERPVIHIWKKAMLVAATVAVIIISTLFVIDISHGPGGEDVIEEISFSVKTTKKGEKLNVSLPDGSFIKLNSLAELKIPSNYGTENERIVYLTGEAFFEVAKDIQKPFKVISEAVITEVLGTTFNVKSNDDNVSIALLEGKVKVTKGDSELLLNPNEMVTIHEDKFTMTGFDYEEIFGWRNNLLVFNKVSFEQITEKLSLWYGVEFVIEGGQLPSDKYSGRFENKPLPLVLEGLGFSSHFEYRIQNKIVHIKFKK